VSAPLPPIPGDRFRLTFVEPRFITWEGHWHLVGPADRLPVGATVAVRQWSTNEHVRVDVTAHVAERTVQRKPGGYLHEVGPPAVRYVVAAFRTPGRDTEYRNNQEGMT
jgi:hypothetical protein